MLESGVDAAGGARHICGTYERANNSLTIGECEEVDFVVVWQMGEVGKGRRKYQHSHFNIARVKTWFGARPN